MSFSPSGHQLYNPTCWWDGTKFVILLTLFCIFIDRKFWHKIALIYFFCSNTGFAKIDRSVVIFVNQGKGPRFRILSICQTIGPLFCTGSFLKKNTSVCTPYFEISEKIATFILQMKLVPYKIYIESFWKRLQRPKIEKIMKILRN